MCVFACLTMFVCVCVSVLHSKANVPRCRSVLLRDSAQLLSGLPSFLPPWVLFSLAFANSKLGNFAGFSHKYFPTTCDSLLLLFLCFCAVRRAFAFAFDFASAFVHNLSMFVLLLLLFVLFFCCCLQFIYEALLGLSATHFEFGSGPASLLLPLSASSCLRLPPRASSCLLVPHSAFLSRSALSLLLQLMTI